jgi:hypothetical protein
VIGLARLLEDDVLVDGDEVLGSDLLNEVLFDRLLGPQELAIGGVEAPGDAGLARYLIWSSVL